MSWFAEHMSMSWIWWTLVIAYGATILSITCVVVSENRNPVKSLAWITVLLVVPVIGLVLYIWFGRNIKNKRIITRRNRRKLRRFGFSEATERPTLPLSEASRRRIKLAYNLSGSNYYENNDAQIFADGSEKFDALIADVKAATEYIHLQYYIFEDDKIGTRLIDALVERAKAGVRVRLVYDHVGSFKLSKHSIKRMHEAGIEASPFFKVTFPPFGTRINFRNHRKLAIIDGKVGYIGGMNVADRYIDGGKDFDCWRDLHLRITGPAIVALQQAFALDWNFMGNPLPEEPVSPTPAPPGAPNMGMQLIIGGPTNQWMNITLMFQQAIADAKKCIYIMTPYFLPSESLLHTLQIAALSSVDVRVMMPRRSDSDMLRWASCSYVSECLRAGIKFYLYEKGMLHSKAIIVDDDFATVGSANFDFRSFEHNFEANMMVYSPEFNQRLKSLFATDMRNCSRITPGEWRRRPLSEKGLESFMRLFAPIL